MSLTAIEFANACRQDNVIYINCPEYPLSTSKVDSLKKIAYLQKYYQCNPVRFINDFFNIELLDAQAWIVQQAWICPQVLLVCSRGFGKSSIVDLIVMAKDMLFNNYWTYIASGSGSQAEETFSTLEKIANDSISSFMGSTGYIFKNEVEIKQAAGDGFSHSNSGFHYNLYNGSFTATVNSNYDRFRGRRGSVVFDECGFLSEELMNVYKAFAIVNQDFRSGKDASGNSIDPIRSLALPRATPNQLFYISSASSTDTEFYRLYRDFSKRMLAGDKKYFVAHITCDVPLRPTIRGKVMPPLFQHSVIESAMRTNPEKARREYYCEFTTEAGADAIIKRGMITRNEEIRKPLLCNDTGDKKFIITYDPARSRDNSVILVSELYEVELPSGVVDKRLRVVNCINLLDMGKKIRSPMRTPDQIDYLKKVILDYNGGADAYGNIVAIYIDAGSGGGGVNIADYLMPDWTDEAGITHRGLIDKEYSSEYVSKFPNAVDKVRLMSPAMYKSTMYEAMIELISQDKISFTAPYDGKGYLMVFDTDSDKYEEEKQRISEKLKKRKLSDDEFELALERELNDVQTIKTKTIKLDWQDELALANIDAMKEEMVNMVRKKRDSGKDSFELTPEKANRMHDDRSYTMALASYGLMIERRKEILARPRKTENRLLDRLPIVKGRRYTSL